MNTAARPSTIRVVSMLFWAEFAPRYRVLLKIAAVLLALCLLKYFQSRDIGFVVEKAAPAMPFHALLELGIMCVATIGVLYCMPRWSEGGITLQPLWQSLALPVRLHRQILVTLGFHIAVALLMGALWGLFRHLDDSQPPSHMPVTLLVAIAVQGQAAMFGCYVLGVVRGLFAFSVGFVASVAAGLMATPLTPFSLATNVCLALVLTGILCCFAAAHLARGSGLPGGILLSRIPPTCFSTRLPSGRLRGKSFSSPFWAQVWFEWRSTAMWLPIVLGGVTLVNYLLLGFDGLVHIVSSIVMPGIYIILPLLIASKYNRITPQYRIFALTRPITSQRVGRAKTASAALALLLVALVTEIPRLVADTLHSGMPTLADAVTDSVLTMTYVVTMTYGLLAFAALLLGTFLSTPLYVLRDLIAGLGDPFAASVFPQDPIPGAGTLATLLAGVIILRALGRRYDASVQWPRELWAAAAALVLPAVIGVLGIEGPVQNHAEFWYVWVTPCITFSALLVYGLRTRLISLRDGAAGLLIFTVLYGMAGYAYTYPTDLSVYFINLHFGHCCVLLASPIVWYPFAVAIQRYEDI